MYPLLGHSSNPVYHHFKVLYVVDILLAYIFIYSITFTKIRGIFCARSVYTHTCRSFNAAVARPAVSK